MEEVESKGLRVGGKGQEAYGKREEAKWNDQIQSNLYLVHRYTQTKRENCYRKRERGKGQGARNKGKGGRLEG